MTPLKGLQGTPVTITGSFTRPVIRIRVDNSFVLNSSITQTPTTLKFLMPRHSEGAVKVTVENGADPALQSFNFDYGKPVVAQNIAEYGFVEFATDKSTLTTAATKEMNTLITKIFNLSGTKTVTLKGIEIDNPKDVTVIRNYNKLLAARIKVVSEAIKKKIPGATVTTSFIKSKAPANTATLKSDKQYLRVTVGLKVS
jgi:hypothetical protein